MTEPTLVAWILFDTTTDKKYIKMNPADGSLAIFDSEEAAIAAKKTHYGTDYKRCEYYSEPQQPPTKCPGAGCTDQGCPAHYADPTPQPAESQPTPEVAKLVEALEEMIYVASMVDGWESFPSDPIERAEEALERIEELLKEKKQ